MLRRGFFKSLVVAPVAAKTLTKAPNVSKVKVEEKLFEVPNPDLKYYTNVASYAVFTDTKFKLKCPFLH